MTPVLMRVYRLATVVLLVLACTQQVAFAANRGDVLVDLGTSLLQFVLTCAGVATAVGGAVVGLRLIIAASTGSSYAASQAVFALLGVGGGLVLAIAGPEIGKAIINATSSLSRNITVP